MWEDDLYSEDYDKFMYDYDSTVYYDTVPGNRYEHHANSSYQKFPCSYSIDEEDFD